MLVSSGSHGASEASIIKWDSQGLWEPVKNPDHEHDYDHHNQHVPPPTVGGEVAAAPRRWKKFRSYPFPGVYVSVCLSARLFLSQYVCGFVQVAVLRLR